MTTTARQPRPGPQRPLPTTPARPPGSMRRTTSIDITRPRGLTGPAVAVLAGQDLATDRAGSGSVVGRWAVDVPLDPASGAVLAFEVPSGDEDAGGAGDLGDLVGATLRSGFGRRLAVALAGDAERRTLRWSLLEDLAGAFLVSGYAPLRAGLFAGDAEASRRRAPLQADICAGWAAGGPVHALLAEQGHTAVPRGPAAPPIERSDPGGWHPLRPPGDGTVRRRRQLDVHRAPGGDEVLVQAHFRDSYAGEEPEMVMHEYAVDAVIDRGRVARIEVDPLVLPWRACPRAVASAQQVVGVAVGELAAAARTGLVGVTTCTHLTSTIRSLADVAALMRPT